jgi:hypothetical protein
MAQQLTKRENVQRQPKPTIGTFLIADWDSFLYAYWLQKIAPNPQFYDDAKTNHGFGCRYCSRMVSGEWKK